MRVPPGRALAPVPVVRGPVVVVDEDGVALAPEPRDAAGRAAEGVLRAAGRAGVAERGRGVAPAPGLGSTRVIQRRFNVSVPRARVPPKASTLRDRSER